MSGYKHSRLETGGLKPLASELTQSEIVINEVDRVLYTKDRNGLVISVGGGSSSGGGQLLGDAAIKGIQYMAQNSSSTDNIVIASGTNGLIVDSFTLQDGATLTIEDNAVLKVV